MAGGYPWQNWCPLKIDRFFVVFLILIFHRRWGLPLLEFILYAAIVQQYQRLMTKSFGMRIVLYAIHWITSLPGSFGLS